MGALLSKQPQERWGARLSLGTAVAVAAVLLLVGWTFYRPQPADTSQPVALEAAQP
jgi:hypothetical protein